jgi:hypothetical protein
MQCLAGIAATRARLGLPAAVVDLPAVSGSGRLAEWANLNELLFTIKRGAMPVHVAQVCCRHVCCVRLEDDIGKHTLHSMT